MTNIVIINGGRGASTIIPAILERDDMHLTSIVNAYDDGKSTGEIRRFFNMLGPSDIRKVQELFLPQNNNDNVIKGLFDFRYPIDINHENAINSLNLFADKKSNKICNVEIKDQSLLESFQEITKYFLDALKIIELSKNQKFNFSDCSIMNCLYAGAFIKNNRNIEKTSDFFKSLFDLRGSVIPNCIENRYLVAQRENGEVLACEADIVELRSNVRIDRIYLLDMPLDPTDIGRLDASESKKFLRMHDSFVEISYSSKEALKSADIIIYSSGTQHSSLYPTYMTRGFGEAIASNEKAFKVFVTNIGADYETPSYKASDFINGAFRYLNLAEENLLEFKSLFHLMLLNENDAKDNYVKLDHEKLSKLDCDILFSDLELEGSPGKHDGFKTLEAILKEFKKFT
jgi:2-phospho-L-lactate transferase/gluconeogenesis factor (CofD/UPF0052 family)